MALAGETVSTGAPNPCPDCGWLSDLGVYKSGAGFYLGHACNCGPYSRESARYWRTEEEAAAALELGEWCRRDTAWGGR